MVNSYQKLLHLSYRNHVSIVVIFLLIIVLTVYLSSNSLWERLDLMGISDGENLLVSVPVTNSDTFTKTPVLKINNKRISYTITAISELEYDATSQLNYQIYTIQVSEKYPLNSIVKLSFYYDQEKIYKKVIKFIKE